MTVSINARRVAARTFYRRAVETQRLKEADAVKDEQVAEVVRANQVDAKAAKRRKRNK